MSLSNGVSLPSRARHNHILHLFFFLVVFVGNGSQLDLRLPLSLSSPISLVVYVMRMLPGIITFCVFVWLFVDKKDQIKPFLKTAEDSWSLSLPRTSHWGESMEVSGSGKKKETKRSAHLVEEVDGFSLRPIGNKMKILFLCFFSVPSTTRRILLFYKANGTWSRLIIKGEKEENGNKGTDAVRKRHASLSYDQLQTAGCRLWEKD